MRQSRTVGRNWFGPVSFLVVLAWVATPHPGRGQGPAPNPTPRQGRGAAGEAPRQVGDLTTRYKLIEIYTTDLVGAKPGEIGQYRVGTRDVLRVMTEKPQGTPDRKETTVQVIYTERPTAVNPSGVVTDTVRRYEAFQVSPATDAKPSAPKPLAGLTVWFRHQATSPPTVMTLTPNRPLSETEYRTISARSVYMPELSGVLPPLPSRVGDRWRIPRSAARAMLGERPLQGEPLVGMLLDVRNGTSDTEQVAVIGVTGRALLPPNGLETAVNAQVGFAFHRPATPSPGDTPGTVEARGTITDLRLSRSSTSALPNTNGRLRRSFTWELNLRRQADAAAAAPLDIPPAPPTPDEANSWLTYDDPQGRFHFRHPQEMLPDASPLLDKEDMVQLVDNGVGAHEGRILSLKLQARTGKAETDKNNRDPDFHVKDLTDEWTRNRQDVIRGPSGWLDKAEWEPHKMRVYRIEAAVKPGGTAGKNVPRVYLDHYLVLFSQNESLVADAMTAQDPPLPFRKQVEQILKTFQLGPSNRIPG